MNVLFLYFLHAFQKHSFLFRYIVQLFCHNFSLFFNRFINFFEFSNFYLQTFDYIYYCTVIFQLSICLLASSSLNLFSFLASACLLLIIRLLLYFTDWIHVFVLLFLHWSIVCYWFSVIFVVFLLFNHLNFLFCSCDWWWENIFNWLRSIFLLFYLINAHFLCLLNWKAILVFLLNLSSLHCVKFQKSSKIQKSN